MKHPRDKNVLHNLKVKFSCYNGVRKKEKKNYESLRRIFYFFTFICVSLVLRTKFLIIFMNYSIRLYRYFVYFFLIIHRAIDTKEIIPIFSNKNLCIDC